MFVVYLRGIETFVAKQAIKKMADSGIRTVNYESGHINRVDVAAKRAILTGIHQTVGEISLMHASAVGCDVMELTAHAAARPNHATWQGQLVSLSGKRGYLSLADIEYGDVQGFKGANCRHDWHFFFPGISTRNWTQEQLKNIDPPTFTHQGKRYNAYEASQKQRQIETAIRKTKREMVGYDAAGLKNEFTTASVKLKMQRDYYQEFSRTAGLRTKHERHQLYGFNKTVSQGSVWARKRFEKRANELYNMGSTHANTKAYLRDKPLRDKLSSMPKIIDDGQQKKHIFGTHEYNQYVRNQKKQGKYGPSYIEIDEKTILELVNKYAGTGILKRNDSGKLLFEIITTNDINVGVVVHDIDGTKAKTSVFKIKYGDKGFHIYPDYPSKKGAKQIR